MTQFKEIQNVKTAFETLRAFEKYTDDEIVDMYLDLGAMGANMDCDEEYWAELSFVYDVRICGDLPF